MTTVNKQITFNDGPTSAGDSPQISGRISGMVVTNNSGVSIAYSSNSGSSFTTLTAGSSVTLGAGDPTAFRFRRVNSGSYPLAVDAVITMSTPMSDGWFDTDPSTGAVSLVGADGAGVLKGPMISGVWFSSPSVFRLRITGTGTVQLDSRNSAGIVTAVATYTVSGATDQIEFPYAGDDAVMIAATFPATVTVEVL